jgi:hypothetical protein
VATYGPRLVVNEATAQWVDSHREKALLALVFFELQRGGLARVASEAEKFLVLSALNLVECIACAYPDS